MENCNIKGILFDLDGTLVDNFHAIHSCASYAARKLGLEPPNFENTVNSVGGSILITMGKLFGEKDAMRLAEIYTENFYRFMFDGLTLMPRTVEFLEFLRKKKYKIALFTNKEEHAAREILSKLSILPYFCAVTGTTLHSPRKPDKEFTFTALNKMKLLPENALIVGDSLYDYNSAQNAGVNCTLVATGTVAKSDLSKKAKNALGIYSDFSEMTERFFGASL